MLTGNSGVFGSVVGCEVDGAAAECPSVGIVGSAAWCTSSAPAVSHPATCETLPSPLFLFPLIPERHTNAQSLLICNQTVTEHKEAVSEQRSCR